MEQGNVTILSIESSCDETAAAVVQNGRTVLGSAVHTQIPIHTLYGGVVPEIASRNHLERIDSVIQMALDEAKMSLEDMDAIAVTRGPGLIGALLVGVAEAKAIAYASRKPLIGVHHIDGHISAVYLESDIKPPFVCLVVSGGHTSLINVLDYGKYELIAQSGDDAAGEAFDKVARAIGLGYPGGPKIEVAAREGNAYAFSLPHPKIGKSYDFSFSGLKTAVLNIINSAKMRGEEINQADMAASFQKTVIDTLCDHTFRAMENLNVTSFALCGGVAANTALRQAFFDGCKKRGISFATPPIKYCTDNAVMIGAAAYPMYLKGEFAKASLNATANIPIEESMI